MKCLFCDKEYGNRTNYHSIWCKKNPNRRVQLNQWSKAKLEGRTWVVSEQTRTKISESSKRKTWTERSRAKLRITMQRVVRERPDSYSGQHRWKKRPQEYKGQEYVSSWEVQVAKILDSAGVSWQRCQKSFDYFWNGLRAYYPDFYVKRYRVFIEVKGRSTERDLEKWKQFPGRLLVINGKGLKVLKDDPSMIRHWLKETREDNGQHYLIS